ncbi:MAG: GNAT family acetyltransferase [Phycisphaerales bacterium]|nr:MAG: GNAT family acetyltransferase [Phycisphaerales bacterium]
MATINADQFTIRSFRSEDEVSVVALWSACGLVVPQNDPRRDIQRKLKVNPEWFFVGEIAGEIVATCMAGYEGHRGWINYLAVAPSHRRRGLATRLVREAERQLRRAGCPKINLQVRTSNTDVIAFYEALGFRVDDVVSMGKRLEPDQP